MRPAYGVLLLCACSLLYDPAKVAVTECFDDASACGTRAQANASCVDNICVFRCTSGFVDADQDLASGLRSNGCESSCAGKPKPRAPKSLRAIAGEKANVVALEFEPPAERPPSFRVCRSGGAGACVDFDQGMVCQGQRCRTELEVNNVAGFEWTIQSVDACGALSDVTPNERVFASALSLSSQDGWIIESNCQTRRATFSKELGLQFSQDNFCVTSIVSASDRWGDVTVLLKLKIDTLLSTAPQVGAVVRSANSDESFIGTTKPADDFDSDPSKMQRVKGFLPQPLASSIEGIPRDTSVWLALTASGNALRLSQSDASMAERPMALWTGPMPVVGRIGVTMVLAGSATIESMLAISPGLAPPAAGNREEQWRFQQSVIPRTVRIQPETANKAVACPSFPSGICENGVACAPQADSKCLEFERSFLAYPYASFAQPLGIDTSKEWSLRFRLAVAADSKSLGLLKVAQGDVLLWPELGPLSSGSTMVGTLDRGKWNAVEFTAQPAAKRMQFRLNGRAAVEVPLPNNFLGLSGAVTLGTGVSTGTFWVTDIQFSQ
jgi:hypothetical protein